MIKITANIIMILVSASVLSTPAFAGREGAFGGGTSSTGGKSTKESSTKEKTSKETPEKQIERHMEQWRDAVEKKQGLRAIQERNKIAEIMEEESRSKTDKSNTSSGEGSKTDHHGSTNTGSPSPSPSSPPQSHRGY